MEVSSDTEAALSSAMEATEEVTNCECRRPIVLVMFSLSGRLLQATKHTVPLFTHSFRPLLVFLMLE